MRPLPLQWLMLLLLLLGLGKTNKEGEEKKEREGKEEEDQEEESSSTASSRCQRSQPTHSSTRESRGENSRASGLPSHTFSREERTCETCSQRSFTPQS